MIVPSPHAPMTCRAVLGTQHRQGPGLLPKKDFDLPVPETFGSTGRIRQRMVVGDSLLQGCRLLSWLSLLEGDICYKLRSLVHKIMYGLRKFVQLDAWSGYYSTFLLHKGTSNIYSSDHTFSGNEEKGLVHGDICLVLLVHRKGLEKN